MILKRVKDRVQGAQEMAEMEHILNVYASQACRKSVAPFLGYLEVPEPRGRLTKGLWLVWDYEGDKTLAYYLRRRDTISALATDMEIDEEAVLPTIMSQIFECLEDIHSAGLVHRDVKPANIVFSDSERRFKLIDLGAAADLRTGTNYKPSETILDPLYCPPEEYVLPTDAFHLSKAAAPLAMAMSPLLWQQHRPDCFDTWSAGVVLLQLGLPFMRAPTTLRNWKNTFARCGYDLEEWRMRSGLSARQTALLDADDGLGWDLAAGLLRPREVESDGRGGVKFSNTSSAPRLTPSAARKHPFLKKAAGRQGLGLSLGSFGSLFSSQSVDNEGSESSDDAPAARSGSSGSSGKQQRGSKSGSSGRSSGRGAEILEAQSSSSGKAKSSSSGGAIASTWGWMKNKLFDLEARVMKQASDTETQTTIVQQLRKDAAAGKISAKELEKEESRLQGMQSTLQESAKELNTFYASAKNFLSSVVKPGEGSGGKGAAPAAVDKEPTSLEAVSSDDASGVSQAVASAATNAIYSGLKFTGRALNAVSDLAAAAERGVSRAQEEAAARRVATGAFVEALQAMKPPITPDSKWEAFAAALPDAEVYAVLTQSQRKQAFQIYVDALLRKRRELARQTAAAYATLLEESALTTSSTFEEFVAVAGKDARFIGVADEMERRAQFEAFVNKRKAAELRAVAAAEAEQAAAERKAAAIKAAAEREAAAKAAAAKREAAAARAAEEAAKVAAEEAAIAEAAAAAAIGAISVEPSPAAAAAVSVPASSPNAEQLEFLKAEQARLKEEYAKMEAKLQEMERALAVQNLAGTLSEEPISIIQIDTDGSMVFKFPAAAKDSAASSSNSNGTKI